MESRPFVTIAIATREDEAAIAACLRAALGQDYPAESSEIVVADAMSMDATREIVLDVASREKRVRLVDNPDRTRAAALNAILRAGRGEIVVPMDPGGEYGRTHVTKCVDALSSSPAEHVAIVPRPSGRTIVERALSAVSATKLAFAAGAELARGSEPVPTLLGAVRKSVFSRVGLFDPKTRAEEDVELSQRITRSGGAITVRRDIVVHRAEAASFPDLWKRQYQLGRSRGRRAVKEKQVGSLRAYAPLAMVIGGSAAAITGAGPLAAAAYALMTGAAAVRVGQKEGLATIPFAWAAYPVMHVAHGVGFGAGLVRALARPDWPLQSDKPDT
jgi:glycosyltransferase involved in cell wall biosynthesis